MKSFTWIRAHRRTLASAAIVTVSAVAVTLLAVLYEGNPTTEVDLNDGGVWVTKRSSLLVGHFNHESAVLDGGLRITADDYDILQSGDTVLLDDPAGNVTVIDPAMVVLTDSATVPAGADVALGGETVAILDQQTGDVRVAAAVALSALESEEIDPQANLGPGGDIAVGSDGTVYGVSPERGVVVTIPVDAEGMPLDASETPIEGIDEDSTVTITVVGDTAVVLDTATGTLTSTAGLHATVPGDGVILQQPSAAAPAVAVATSDQLLEIPLDGSDPTATPAGGTGVAAAPVTLNGCLYAAWSGSARFVRDCIGEDGDLEREIPGVDARSELRFRVNRDVVVLNDIIGGAAWMASEDLQQVDNWDDIIPPEGEEEENDDEETEETVETTLPERSETNTKPDAVDDAYGVRPGRTTILPVLDNDNDVDGDVLTVSLPNGAPDLGEMQSINNGSGLQIAVPEDASGTEAFTYEVDDGRTGTDRATVRLTVHDWDVNAAPTQKRTASIAVESGGFVTYNVLPDWIDPDGDDVFLSGVTAETGDEVDFTPDGRITYRALSGAQGRRDIPVLVSDGEKTTEGTLRLDVRPPGSTTPVTIADHVVTQTGKTVTVSPLVNDLNAGKDPLRLARVDDVAGASIGFDPASGTFTFSADKIGTYYVQYLAASGASGVPGIVRVDVVAGGDTDAAPIAVRDVALLRSGGEVLVDVLANDIDPAGGILVVQSVTVPPASGISVSVLNHETLRIADQSALGEQVIISYRISNGSKSAEGSVVVIPVPAPAKIRPPVAADDEATVRVGDIVTIPVLDNDYSPSGSTIHVAPDLVAPLPEADEGEVFVSQDTVRFRATGKPGMVNATYQVVDAVTGQKDSAYVKIRVLPMNEETNAAPRPREVTARVLSGTVVHIPITLDGIDPDGDSVELVGVVDAPRKGIATVDVDTIAYEALDGSTGTDTFAYRVRDRLGAEGIATITVGIAQGETFNQAPYAVKDAIVMRPGRAVAVPVRENDSDPDGDEFGIVPNGLVLPDVPGLEAEVRGDRVVVTSPDQPVETGVQYKIRDSRGGEATAVLQITVKPDVPLSSPIARDDRIRPEDVTGETIDVAVLENDEDPDGTREALTLSVDEEGAQVRPDGILRVTLLDQARIMMYTVTDEDGLTASAFVFVPAIDGLPPTLLSTEPVEVRSGETVELPLADYVRGWNGRDIVLTEAAKVSALHADGASLLKDQSTLVYTSADRYFGPDAVTFEVTDGSGPDDPNGVKATLSIRITVLPPENQSPTFIDGRMSVAPGEDPVSLDLAALTSDPDAGDVAGMEYSIVGGVPDGFTATIDDQSLSVSASVDTPKETTATVQVRLDDGESEPVEGSVLVTVTASTRPLTTANDDVIDQADQGRTRAVEVLRNDIPPFPGSALTVMSASVETGQGTAVVAGDRVEVTPADDFVGRMVVRYRVQDATKDPDREVEARIRLTVQGRPDAPGKPTVTSVQDRTVVLSWSPPVDNGASITGYTVTSTTGGYTKDCVATTCTLNGLTNNVEYNFTVTATNRVGVSDPSPISETARPDARPDTPQPPTLTFGDRSLTVAWVTPSTPGSPVESFTLEITPAPPSGISQKTNVKGNSIVWEGLENGTNYQVRVRAHNRAPEPSEWSGLSAGETPAAPPAGPAAPSSRMLDSVGTQSQLQATWTQPNDNGADISGYELEVRRGGSVIRTVKNISGSTLSQAVTVDNNTTGYTFRVRAMNKAGWGDWGAESAPRRAAGTPAAPTGVTALAGDRRISVSYTAGSLNGASVSEVRYQYSLNGGGWSNWSGGDITSGVNNSTKYTVRVRAVSTVDGSEYAGAASAASNQVEPFGKPGQPGAGASASGTNITYSWSPPARNGRDITRMEINIDNGGWTAQPLSGSLTRSYGYSTGGSIQVRVTDSEGQQNTNSASATTGPQPSWSITPTVATCVQPDFNYSRYNANGPTCSSYWLRPSDGPQTVSCYLDAANWKVQSDPIWFWIPSRSVWMSRASTTGSMSGMPQC